MLATPHLIVGAAIGKASQRPWLVLLAAFGSHFALDALPHIDSHSLYAGPGNSITRREVTMSTLDSLVGITLVLWAVRGQARRRVMLLSAFLAVLLDVVFNLPPWGARLNAWPGTSWLGSLHHAVSHSVGPGQWPIGFSTQAIVVGIGLWVLLLRRRKEGAKT